jgi:Orsellinic acid/F9775 biosynthesis cluster protein D
MLSRNCYNRELSKTPPLVNFLTSSMAQPVPLALSHLVALNAEYNVLICISNSCKHVLKPTAISRHLDIKHKTPLELRKQLDQYVRESPFAYNSASVSLPHDGLAPQPIIPIVDGFACRDCLFKSVNRGVIRQHGNKAHNKKGVLDDEIFQAARLQSWFGEKRERYWVVDESQQHRQEDQAYRAMVQDVGEEPNDLEQDLGSRSDNGDSQGEVEDLNVQDIDNWKAEAQGRRLRVQNDVPAMEIDSWLHYTGWNEVLGRSKHNLVTTSLYTCKPDPSGPEPELERVLRAWDRIFERCLDTLANTNQKDILKWWGSPKNEAAGQRPFELLQNAASIKDYSRVWERLLCYIIRTGSTDDWEEQTGV